MSVYVSQGMHCSPVLPVRLCHLVGRHQCLSGGAYSSIVRIIDFVDWLSVPGERKKEVHRILLFSMRGRAVRSSRETRPRDCPRPCIPAPSRRLWCGTYSPSNSPSVKL